MLSAFVSSFFSRKSPECNADLGRSISIPAEAWSRCGSGVGVRDVLGPGVKSSGVFGRSREVGRKSWLAS